MFAEFLAFIAGFQKLSGVAILLFAVYFIVIAFSKNLALFEYLDRRRGHQFEKIDTYLSKSEHSDAATRKAVAEVRDTIAFKLATGISANIKFRTSLIALYDRTSHAVGWREIKKALEYLEVGPTGAIVVKNERTPEVWLLTFHRSVAYFFLLFGVIGGLGTIYMGLSFVLLSYKAPDMARIAGQFAVMTFLGFMFALISVQQIQPILKARMIRKELLILDAPTPPA